MAEQSFADALNEQISNEFAASQQYIGSAVYYDTETLPRLAAFFYRQAVEERNHAMIMIQYLLDTDEEVRIPDIKSQVEEVSSMTDLLNVCERAQESPLLIEEFLAREQIGNEGDDPSSPPAA